MSLSSDFIIKKLHKVKDYRIQERCFYIVHIIYLIMFKRILKFEIIHLNI